MASSALRQCGRAGQHRAALAPAVGLLIVVGLCAAQRRAPGLRPQPGKAARVAAHTLKRRLLPSPPRLQAPAVTLSFGIQPTWIPACILWEVMARDPILKQDLLKDGHKLVPIPFIKGQDMNRSLLAGRLQGGFAGDLPALTLAARIPLSIVSLVQQGPCFIIARHPVTVAGLRGRRIAYAPGSNAHAFLMRALWQAHLRASDVHLIAMDVPQMNDALAAGRVDAYAAWQYTPALGLLNHPDFEVVARGDTRGYMYFVRPFARQSPAAVAAMVRAEIRALKWLHESDRNLYTASSWAYDSARRFAHRDLPITVYDFFRLAREDILRIPSAPRLLPSLLAPGGEVFEQFQLARSAGLLPPGSRWDRVRAAFATDLVPRLLAAGRATDHRRHMSATARERSQCSGLSESIVACRCASDRQA